MEVSAVLAEIWRGEMLECVHRGTAVVARATGEIVDAWGDPARIFLPRSSCKMFQALPLVESGAADAAGLNPEHLALAAASHQGAGVHTRLARAWLEGLGLDEPDLRCGAHLPSDGDARFELRQRGKAPDQTHNNCSGKHCGFLTATRRLGGGPEYIDPDHPVQRAVKAAFEECCDEATHGHVIDGCSAPNFAISIGGLARAAARFARPHEAFTGTRAEAAERIVEAMAAHPVLVAGEKRAGTAMMRAASGGAVVKSGAEGAFVGILPAQGLGIAIKVDDGAGRGAQAAIAALLARYGALDRADPAFLRYADHEITNHRGMATGRLRAAPALLG